MHGQGSDSDAEDKQQIRGNAQVNVDLKMVNRESWGSKTQGGEMERARGELAVKIQDAGYCIQVPFFHLEWAFLLQDKLEPTRIS